VAKTERRTEEASVGDRNVNVGCVEVIVFVISNQPINMLHEIVNEYGGNDEIQCKGRIK